MSSSPMRGDHRSSTSARRRFCGGVLVSASAALLAWLGRRLPLAVGEPQRQVFAEEAACGHQRQTCVSMEVPGFDPNRKDAHVYAPCAEKGCSESRGFAEYDEMTFVAMGDDPFTGEEVPIGRRRFTREGRPGSMRWVPVEGSGRIGRALRPWGMEPA